MKNQTRSYRNMWWAGHVFFILGKSEQFNDRLMPVHIAASLQYSFEYEDSRNGFGYGEFAKLRLKQYLNSLKNFGIHRILENKTMTYKEDFIKYHLIPGIYCADHIFVHDVMSEFHQLMWGSCYFDRASNDEFSVECLLWFF